jgi:hypothetical protein
MDASAWIISIIAIAVVLAIAISIEMRSRRSRREARLRGQFGTEYDRTIEGADKRRQGERDLQERIDLRDRLDIRPLTASARERYTEQWRAAQTRFVDQPTVVVTEVDALVTDVMRERGYPVDDWDQQAAVVSVEHPQVVEDYRVAHEVADRSRANEASTDDLREAFLRYRSLFDALLDERDEVAPSDDVEQSDAGTRR